MFSFIGNAFIVDRNWRRFQNMFHAKETSVFLMTPSKMLTKTFFKISLSHLMLM